jgi:CDP-glucose 4,6-dehydratase
MNYNKIKNLYLKKKNKTINNFYKNKKVLITGATGFKGSWLSYWLYSLGAKVYAVGYNPNQNGRLFDQLNLKNKINLKIIDVRNYISFKNYLNKIKPEIIFHLAAQPIIYSSYLKPIYTYQVNSVGTLNLLEILRNYKISKSVIFITSDKCYESNNSTKGFSEEDKLGGVDPYSGSKACAEIIINTYYNSFLKKSNIGIASARAGNVIGGGDWSLDRLIPDAIKCLKMNKKISIRNPKFNRPWQHVLEPLDGYLLLAMKLYRDPKKYSGPWNFGTEKNTITNVEQIIKKIIRFWGYGKYSTMKNKKYYEQKNLQLNINKAKQKLHWFPKLTIDQSIKLTTEWYKEVLIKKRPVEEITMQQIKKYQSI